MRIYDALVNVERVALKPKKSRIIPASAIKGLEPVTVSNITVTRNGNAKSRLGRPPTGKAMTNAQRQAKFKALKKAHEK